MLAHRVLAHRVLAQQPVGKSTVVPADCRAENRIASGLLRPLGWAPTAHAGVRGRCGHSPKPAPHRAPSNSLVRHARNEAISDSWNDLARYRRRDNPSQSGMVPRAEFRGINCPMPPTAPATKVTAHTLRQKTTPQRPRRKGTPSETSARAAASTASIRFTIPKSSEMLLLPLHTASSDRGMARGRERPLVIATAKPPEQHKRPHQKKSPARGGAKKLPPPLIASVTAWGKPWRTGVSARGQEQ